MSNPYDRRTVLTLRKMGYLVEKVERFNTHSGTRHDLFGIIDYIAIAPDITLGVQSTSRGCLLDHRKKLRASEHAFEWIDGPRELVLVGWDQPEPRKWRGRWELVRGCTDRTIDFQQITAIEVAKLTAYAE